MSVRRGEGLRRTRLIIVREARERVTQKAYRLALLAVMVLAAAAVVVPALIDGDGGGRERVPVALSASVPPETTGAQIMRLQEAADQLEGPAAPQFEPQPGPDALRTEVRDGGAPLGLEIGAVPGGADASEARLVVREDGGGELALRVVRIAERAALLERAQGLSPEQAAVLTARAPVGSELVAGAGTTAASATVVMVLALFTYIGGLLLMTGYASGLVSDRASRVSERLLTAARPIEHLAGKLAGTWIAGVIQLGAAFGVALIATLLVSGSGATSPFSEVPIAVLIYFPIGFIGSYLLYAALATVLVLPARKTEDVGGLLGAATMLQIIAFVLASTLLTPGATVPGALVVASLIPFFAPVMMLARFAAGDVPVWEAAVGVAGPFVLAALILWAVAPAYARHAIDAPGGRGLGAAWRALRA